MLLRSTTKDKVCKFHKLRTLFYRYRNVECYVISKRGSVLLYMGVSNSVKKALGNFVMIPWAIKTQCTDQIRRGEPLIYNT